MDYLEKSTAHRYDVVREQTPLGVLIERLCVPSVLVVRTLGPWCTLHDRGLALTGEAADEVRSSPPAFIFTTFDRKRVPRNLGNQ